MEQQKRILSFQQFKSISESYDSDIEQMLTPDKKEQIISQIKKLGIAPETTGEFEFIDEEGEKHILMLTPDGELILVEAMTEGFRKNLLAGIVCTMLVGGMISCTKEDSLEPNNIENSLEANVDFFNTQGLNVPLEVIAKSMYPVKIKYAKDRNKQTPTLSMGKIDSAVNNQDEPWCGYWKFTDPCRYDNGQVWIWTNPTDSEPYGSIWSGYQTVTPRVDSSWNGFHLLKGKKYLIHKYTIHSFKYDKVKAHVSITMSNPNHDRGKLFSYEIDYSGKTMRITNWQAGNAVEVGGFDGFNFKW